MSATADYDRAELDVQERLPGPPQGDFGFDGAVGGVERRPGRAAFGDLAQLPDGAGAAQPGRPVEFGILELHQGCEVRVLGDAALQGGGDSAGGGRGRCKGSVAGRSGLGRGG
ncbi:MAG: hypothetical protein JWN05_2551, partial [Arthrobacter sp.]|nr:hypothetical protein [Arthrobacter sp.]